MSKHAPGQIKITHISNEHLTLVSERPFSLNGGLSTNEWLVSHEKLGALLTKLFSPKYAAAPELLEVCKLALGALSPGCGVTRDRIERAIAKAEGKE